MAVAVLLLLVSVSGIIAFSAATTTAEQEDLVYLNDDRDVLIPEYQVSTTEVADTGTIQVEFLVQNTSRTTQTGSIDFIFNSAGSTVEVMPDSPQNTVDYTLDPGERQEFTVNIKFNSSVGGTPIGFRETGPLQIVDTTRSVSPQQISTITVLPYSSSVGSGTISPEGEPEQVTKSFSSFTDDGPTSVANFSDDIPPLSQSNNEYKQDSLGRILDFNNSRSPQNDGMILRADSNGDLRTGVSVENVPDSEYYQLQFNYIIPGSMDGISVRLVDSTGEEIDKDTSYNLANQPDRRSQYITLSQAEAEYIRSSKQINVVFESYDNDPNSEAEIYFTQLISSESAISTASPDIVVEEQKIVTYEEWNQFRNLGRTETNWDAITAENQFARNQQYVVAWKATNQGSSFGEQRIELNENGSIVDFVTISLNPAETKYIGTVISRQQPQEYVYQSSGTESIPAESIFVGTNIEADPIAQIDKSGSDFVNGSYIADPAGDTINISASKSFGTTGSDIVSYDWSTDGLGSYSGENISVPVNSQGSFDVVLTVTDEDGKTDTDSVTIEAGTIPPEAETLPDISRNAGETILFSAENSSHPDPNKDASDLSYEWEVVDESTYPMKTGLTQTYLFTEPGEYKVRLTVTDTNGNSDTDTRTIQIGNPQVNAFIDASTTNPIVGETAVTFDASDSYSEVGSINEYRFNFNDGSATEITTSPTVTHTFSSSGERTVEVTVENDNGQTDSEQVIINVQNDPFTLNISGDTSGPTAKTFEFSANDSRNLYNADSLTWELGDGTQVTDASTVTHSYDEPGSYTVTLQGEDSETGFTDSDTLTIDVGYSDPNAILTSSLTEGQDIYYSNFSSFNAGESNDPDGTDLTYTFSVQNGQTSSGAVTDQNLCGDAEIDTCTQTSNSSIKDYIFPTPGEQTMTVTVQDSTPEENTDTDTFTVNVINRGVVYHAYANENELSETPQITTYISNPVTFDSTNSYHLEEPYVDFVTEWDLGDGTTRTGQNIDYKWDQPGTYNVDGTMEDDFGDSESESIEVVVEARDPVADFERTNPQSDTQTADFSDLSAHNEPDGQISSYQWNFGDGTTSTTPNPSHTYDSYGQFDVTLTIEDQWGQTDTITKQVSISGSPTARLQTSSSTVQTSESFTLDASQSTGGAGASISEYRWDLNGDGSIDRTTTQQTSVTHSYDTTGSYNPSVTIVNTAGATDTENVNVSVEQANAQEKTYIIDNPTNKSTTNYQVDITVEKEPEMDSNYESIRFYQNGDPLDYHRVSYNNNRGNFVVELNEISSNGAVIKMTYGGDRGSQSDPEATYLAYDYHNTGMDDGQFGGDAFDVNDSYARLTPNQNSQRGSLQYGSVDVGVKANYTWRIAPYTGNNAADSLNFYAFNNGNRYEHEDPNGNGLSFSVVDHNTDECVTVNYNQQCDVGSTFNYNQDTSWHNATVEVAKSGTDTYNYYYDSGASGVPVFDGTITASNIGDRFGFSGRTGGKTNRHEVQNITLRKWLGEEMNTSTFDGEYIDSFERGNLNPYNVSDTDHFFTTANKSAEGDYSMRVEVSSGGNSAVSTSGLNKYPTRGDYWTTDIQFENNHSWNETYGTQFSIGWGGTDSTPEYEVELSPRDGRLELQNNGNVVDTTPVSWSNYQGEPLRLHVDYDAHGDGMIRAHVLTQNWDRVGTVQIYDPNGPTTDSHLSYNIVGDRSFEGQVYVDSIKTTKNQIYTDDFDEAGLRNWTQENGNWSTNSGTLVEDTTFNSNSISNSNVQLDVSNGLTMNYESRLNGDYANFNNMRLVGGGNIVARTGHGHNDYSGEDSILRAFAGGEGNTWKNQGNVITANNWQTVELTYTNPDNCNTTIDGTAYATLCSEPTQSAQEIYLSGWSHVSGDRWRDFFIRAHTSDTISFEANSNGQPVYDDSFENYSTGSSPWLVDNDNSNDDISVSTNRAIDGSQSLRSRQPNTGSPSHFDAATNFGGVSNTTTVVEYSADMYVDGKLNGGTANDFSLRLLDTASTDTDNKSAFTINMVRNGSYISAGSTNVRSDIRNQWVDVRVVVDYSQNNYTLYINGTDEGTYAMTNGGSPEDFDYLVIRNDNYDGYIDDITITPLS